MTALVSRRRMQRRITALVRQRCMRRRITVLVSQRCVRRADNGVGKATVSPSRHSRSTHRPPNFVILRAVAESISPCQRTTQKTQRPLHTTMDTATSRSMTALVRQRCMRRADNGVGKPTVPPSRHPQSTHRPPNFVILRAVAESISPCQRTTQKIQRPLHTTMDTATSRSMTALVRQRCMRRRITALVRQRRPPPVIPEVPSAPQLRHSARSRRIHLPLPTHHPENPASFARHHGYCDFAQYDGVGKPTAYAKTDNGVGKPTAYARADNGVGRATASPSRHPQSTHRPPNFVILRAVAESISPCQRTTQKTQRPLHTTMDTATSRSMTALVSRRRMRRADNGVGKATVYAKADNGVGKATAPPSRHPQSTLRPQTSSSPKYPPPSKLRHSARSRRIHLRLPTHHPENPASFARHPTVYAKADNGVLCTPPWILRLRAV